MRFSGIHTRNIRIKRRFTRRLKCTEFCDSFSSSQEGHFRSVDRFKWHHSGANLPNEPSCYHGKKWTLGNIKSLSRYYTLIFTYSCLYRYVLILYYPVDSGNSEIVTALNALQNATFRAVQSIWRRAWCSHFLTIFKGQITIKCNILCTAACEVFLGNIIRRSASEINIV